MILDREQLGALASEATSPLSGAFDELPGGVRETLIEAVAATTSQPLAEVELRVRCNGGELQAVGWLGDVAVLAVPERPGAERFHLIVDGAASLPRVVAGLVALGPRPAPPAAAEEVVTLPRTSVEELTGMRCPDDRRAELRAAAAPGGAAADTLAALLDAESMRWTLTVRASGDAGEPAERCVDVIDAGDLGLWLLFAAGADGVLAVRATPTAVWRALASC